MDPGGSTISLRSLAFDIMRVRCSVVTWVGLYADEDPGPGGNNFRTRIGSISLPRETSEKIMKTRKVAFRLDNVTFLQNVKTRVKLRLRFSGSKICGTTWYSTCLDDIAITGRCSPSQARVTALGPANCTPLVTMNIDKPPTLGTTVTVSVRANYPRDPIYLFVSAGCGKGVINLPPTTCKNWLDPSGYHLVDSAMLDTSGRATFPLRILASYAPLSGMDIGAQTLLLSKDGASMSNGLCLRIGRK